MNFTQDQIEFLRTYIVMFDVKRPEGNLKPRHDKSILQELEKVPNIRKDVLDKANEIYASMNVGTRRGNKRTMLKTYLVMCALQELNLPFNPSTISNLITSSSPSSAKSKKKISSLSTAASTFSPIQTGYQPLIVAYDCRMFIGVFAIECGVTDDVMKDMVNFATRILKKCPELHSDHAIKVAAGMINYYVNIKGIAISLEKVGEISGLSSATMSDTYNKIAKIDNI